jgi:hypothetical protein
MLVLGRNLQPSKIKVLARVIRPLLDALMQFKVPGLDANSVICNTSGSARLPSLAHATNVRQATIPSTIRSLVNRIIYYVYL